ncbi:unnamed protein product [Lampetra planeri]
MPSRCSELCRRSEGLRYERRMIAYPRLDETALYFLAMEKMLALVQEMGVVLPIVEEVQTSLWVARCLQAHEGMNKGMNHRPRVVAWSGVSSYANEVGAAVRRLTELLGIDGVSGYAKEVGAAARRPTESCWASTAGTATQKWQVSAEREAGR